MIGEGRICLCEGVRDDNVLNTVPARLGMTTPWGWREEVHLFSFLLENFDEHTRVIRLYPRPIVTIKTSTLIKGLKDSPFLKQFSTTQVFIQLIYSMLSSEP